MKKSSEFDLWNRAVKIETRSEQCEKNEKKNVILPEIALVVAVSLAMLF